MAPKMYSDVYGKFIRNERHRADLTLAQVADTLGVSISYLSDIERGQRAPPNRELQIKLANAVNGQQYVHYRAFVQAYKKCEINIAGSSEQVQEIAISLTYNWHKLSKKQLSKLQVLGD